MKNTTSLTKKRLQNNRKQFKEVQEMILKFETMIEVLVQTQNELNKEMQDILKQLEQEE